MRKLNKSFSIVGKAGKLINRSLQVDCLVKGFLYGVTQPSNGNWFSETVVPYFLIPIF